MEKTLEQVYQEYCNLVYACLLTNCPVDTGNMITHIRYNNDGTECHIIIDTVPYSKAPLALKRRQKRNWSGKPIKEVEYAAYTEYRNKSKGWIRRNSLYVPATFVVGDGNVICEIDLGR